MNECRPSFDSFRSTPSGFESFLSAQCRVNERHCVAIRRGYSDVLLRQLIGVLIVPVGLAVFDVICCAVITGTVSRTRDAVFYVRTSAN